MPKDTRRKSLRQLAASAVEKADLPAILDEIRDTSDRTAAIVLASLVERTVEQSITQALPRRDDKTIEKLQARDGPLGNFYAKNHLGFALGIYDEVTRDNLEIIRKIRNAFAHTVLKITFETEQIIDEVKKLKFDAVEVSTTKLGEFSEYRTKYTYACSMFAAVSRLKWAGERMELIKRVVDLISPHLAAMKRQVPPDLSEKLKTAVEATKKLKYTGR